MAFELITDRRPTKADEDEHGEVIFELPSKGGWVGAPHTYRREADLSWTHSPKWEPPKDWAAIARKHVEFLKDHDPEEFTPSHENSWKGLEEAITQLTKAASQTND